MVNLGGGENLGISLSSRFQHESFADQQFFYTLLLGELREDDIPLAGGKAVNLSLLLSKGFPVPSGFVLTTLAFREFIQSADIFPLLRDSNPEEIRRRVLCANIPSRMVSEIEQRIESLGINGAVAVRSSAVAEDLKGASFAGVYETILGVRGIEEIIRAVKEIWASIFSERAQAYRARQKVSLLDEGIAIVIQRLVQASSSGIMFTTNPLTAHPGEVVIEAVTGLGEGAVSGRVQPDHIVLRKSNASIKKWRTKGEKPCCSVNEISSLVEMARRLEFAMGAPQDVEWAIENGEVLLLQSRPITTLPSRDEPVYTRKMGDQYWTDVISPMSFTCGVNWIVEGAFVPLMRAIGLPQVAELNFFRLHKSHLYMNTLMAYHTITMFPKSAREHFASVMGSPHDKEYLLSAPHRPLKAWYSVIRGHLLDENSGMSNNLRLLKRWSVEVEDRTRKMLRLLEHRPRLDKLMKMFHEVNRMGVRHFEIIRWGHASYNTTLTDLFRDLCLRFACDTDCELFYNITSHVDLNMTLETDQALWETALALGEDPQVKNLIQQCSPTDSARELLDTDKYPKARRILQKFLSEFGHRTTSRDITAPHWSDEPAQVISVIKGILCEEIPESPHARAQKSKIRMESAMKEARHRILKKWHGFLSWFFFKYIADKTRLFIGYRENQRFTLDRIIFVMRKIALEIGSRLVEMGVLEQADDVFFLNREELERLVKEQRTDTKLNERIMYRRKEHTTNKEVLPSAYIKGNFEFDEEEEEKSIEEGMLCGLNASPGIVEGVARVLTDIQCAHELKNGEILVTESTDPAWSAAFMKVGGLVLETGGVLSHGAILAREFGIPAVTHVKGATKLIKTGQRIRVDGTRGRVMFLENLS